MAAKLFKVTIFKSKGSRKSRDIFRNVYHLAIDDPIFEVTVVGAVNDIVTAEKAGSLETTHFLRAHIVQVADNLLNQPNMEFKTIELDGTGSRPVDFIDNTGPNPVLINQLMPDDLCVVVSRQTQSGRNSKAFYRGMLRDGDVEVGRDGSWVLVNPDTFFDADTPNAARLVNLLNVANADGIFALKGSVTLFVTNARIVTKFVLGGVSTRQVTQSKTSIASAERAVVVRKIKKAYNAIKKLLGDTSIANAPANLVNAIKAFKDAAEALWDALPVEDQALLLLRPNVKTMVTFLELL